MSLPTVTWVIKLSKLCNMRCSYCYEWNSLSNPSRMSPGTWRTVLRHMAGVTVPTWRRSERGDTVFLVNLDAKVYRVLDAYQEDLALGDLSAQSIREVLTSASYYRSLARDAQDFQDKCRSCAYLGACSGAFIHDSRTSSYSGNCSTAQPCIDFMQRYIAARAATARRSARARTARARRGDRAASAGS